MDLFNDFKNYIEENGYKIQEISETSIRGIKGELKIHLFQDFLNDDYVFNVNNNGIIKYNTSFVRDGLHYRLEDNNYNRDFTDIFDIIDYTRDQIDIEI